MIDSIDDNELISMLCENDENVKNLIYEKYGYIIDVLLKKYYRALQIFDVDEQEIRCEALYGFSDGINAFSDNKNASLKTFLTICIERRITKYLNKVTTKKYKVLNDALSLDYVSEKTQNPLIETISDDSKYDPLNNLTYFETFDEIISLAKENLSEFEFDVFKYMINEISYVQIATLLDKSPKQIDNTIQRIKSKMRKLLSESINN